MRIRYLTALTLLLCSGAAVADRQPGWDFGGDLIYAFSTDIDFTGGSRASLDDDLGIGLSFNYRFNPRLELMIGLDWNQVDYDVTVAPGDAAAGLGFSATEGSTNSVADGVEAFDLPASCLAGAALTPASLSATLECSATGSKDFTIHNTSAVDGTDLTWSISRTSSDCATPTDLPWVTASP